MNTVQKILFLITLGATLLFSYSNTAVTAATGSGKSKVRNFYQVKRLGTIFTKSTPLPKDIRELIFEYFCPPAEPNYKLNFSRNSLRLKIMDWHLENNKQLIATEEGITDLSKTHTCINYPKYESCTLDPASNKTLSSSFFSNGTRVAALIQISREANSANNYILLFDIATTFHTFHVLPAEVQDVQNIMIFENNKNHPFFIVFGSYDIFILNKFYKCIKRDIGTTYISNILINSEGDLIIEREACCFSYFARKYVSEEYTALKPIKDSNQWEGIISFSPDNNRIVVSRPRFVNFLFRRFLIGDLYQKELLIYTIESNNTFTLTHKLVKAEGRNYFFLNNDTLIAFDFGSTKMWHIGHKSNSKKTKYISPKKLEIDQSISNFYSSFHYTTLTCSNDRQTLAFSKNKSSQILVCSLPKYKNSPPQKSFFQRWFTKKNAWRFMVPSLCLGAAMYYFSKLYSSKYSRARP